MKKYSRVLTFDRKLRAEYGTGVGKGRGKIRGMSEREKEGEGEGDVEERLGGVSKNDGVIMGPIVPDEFFVIQTFGLYFVQFFR